jgi:NADH:ubiquinone oxidoreductase subunit F (NADH-binding)
LIDRRSAEELAASRGVGHGGVVAFDEHIHSRLIETRLSFGHTNHAANARRAAAAAGASRKSSPAPLAGNATQADLQECRELVVALNLTSLCGHGTGLARAESILRYYPTEVEPCFVTINGNGARCEAAISRRCNHHQRPIASRSRRD